MENLDVQLVKVRKEFGSLVAVDDVDMEVPKGSFFSILGPSGGGKSTLLRMISGFEKPDAGSVFIGGELSNDVPPNRRKTNLVFQNLALFPTMNVAQNISFGLKRRHVNKSEIAKKVEHVLGLVDLPGLGSRKVSMLSGGQRQRVALARSLVLDPTVLLLDEPLGALDLKLRENMKLVLKRLQARVGTTFIYVTHDQSEALTMSNMIAVINKGKIEQISAPLDLFYTPKSYFVAKFIGDNNCWEGVVVSSDENTCEVKVGSRSFNVAAGENLSKGDKVSVFIRPEIMHLVPESDENGIRGIVKEAVFDGTYTRILIDSDLGNYPLEILVKISQSEAPSDVKIGDKVSVSWKEGAGVAFHRPADDSVIEGVEE